MTADEMIKKALDQIGIPYEEEIYHGKKDKYIVFNEADQIPYLYVDNAPMKEKTFYQVHYFCPLQPKASDDSRTVTRKIRSILQKFDFCITQTRRTSDQMRHVIIECNVITKSEEREE